MAKKPRVWWKPFESMLQYVHNHITSLNQSKLFAGLIIITLNISSKFVSIKLSKSMEAYLKYTFSRDILIFAMAWMGTRDIYVALFITLLFSLCMNYLFNEESAFCCLPETFTDYHTQIMDASPVSEEEVTKAKDVLAKYEAQQKESGGAKPETRGSQTGTQLPTH
jgi:hypothetical protein